MLFWHLGGTIALIRYAFRDDRMDLRFLALGAVLPDLIDTPIGFLAFSATQSVRLVGHSLLFAAAVMVAVLVTTRRGRPRKRWMPLAVGVLVHLFLDAMWTDPETLWWPFLGAGFAASGAASATDYLRDVVTSWQMWTLEALGLAYLAVLGTRARLGERHARSLLWTTGRVDVPIERA